MILPFGLLVAYWPFRLTGSPNGVLFEINRIRSYLVLGTNLRPVEKLPVKIFEGSSSYALIPN